MTRNFDFKVFNDAQGDCTDPRILWLEDLESTKATMPITFFFFFNR